MLVQTNKNTADILNEKKQLRIDGTFLITNSEKTNIPKDIVHIEPTITLHDVIESGNLTSTYIVARTKINISKAILFSEEQLSNDIQGLSPLDPDKDSLFIWQEYAEKISVEDLQRL
ncbi:hypothetical protein ACM5Q9_00235 [Advenella sp. RU8]|uniref:hypothetical protein n=1 Tax=Advenella sp. RU8 TaxID=3399575 RepID=UPI003AACD74D